MGAQQQRIGQDFEDQLKGSFEGYMRAGLATLSFMPIPMYHTGLLNPKTHQPMYCPKGKPPFDIYGYWHVDATMIGAELKSTYKDEVSMPLVGPDKDGDGLQYHQLMALAHLSVSGGIARVVWNNAGQIGVLYGSKIVQAAENLNEAIKLEKQKQTPARGAKSVKWDEFRIVQPRVIGGVPMHDWLMIDSIV